MEIKCEHCNAKLNIPDEKIPTGQKVKISCPKCKGKLTLNPREPVAEDPESSGHCNENSPKGISEAARGFKQDGVSLEVFEKEVKLALVMEDDPAMGEKIAQGLEELGYTYIPAENTNQAISKMRFHDFSLLILSDMFDGIKLDQSPILQYLNHLAMSVRRKMFVALIGDSFNTMDNMTAFVRSVNLVINDRDVDKLAGILSNAISDNDQFYKVFRETLMEIGRA